MSIGERDFDEELATHLEMLADEYRRRGMSAEEAGRAARRAYILNLSPAAPRVRRGLLDAATAPKNRLSG